MTTAPANVESLIRIASRLIVVLEREIELLRAMKAGALAGLRDEKNGLVAAYEEQVRALSAAPDELRRVAPALQEEFARIADRFEAAMTENRRALSAASEAQNRFMQAVVKAAREKQTSFRGYSAAGAISVPHPKKVPQAPLALTLDRRF
ncbi:MAG: hypothetical protein WD470_07680 [Rhodospirillaceae bacterium]